MVPNQDRGKNHQVRKITPEIPLDKELEQNYDFCKKHTCSQSWSQLTSSKTCTETDINYDNFMKMQIQVSDTSFSSILNFC